MTDETKLSLPQYKSHKVVGAARIISIDQATDPVEGGSYILSLEGGATREVVTRWFNKHLPEVGGYFVEYSDGYASYSPSKAFEEGYLPVVPMLAPGVTSAQASSVERDIQSKGLTAPRITPADIENVIVSEHYFTADKGAEAGLVVAGPMVSGLNPVQTNPAALKLLTFCVLVLRNGFTVTGESACASPENFDAEIGIKIARENAKAKLWPLLGYQLKDRLHEAQCGEIR